MEESWEKMMECKCSRVRVRGKLPKKKVGS